MDSSDRKAYVAGLRVLGRREVSTAQLRQRLERQAYDPADIDAALARLQAEHALDDRRTALACARSEVRLKGRGPARVRLRLRALGLDPVLVDETLRAVFGDEDERSLVERALDRRLRQGTLSDPATERRLHRFLLGQGFSPSLVRDVLRRRRAGDAPHDD
ncbi:MAG: regulatory protein RecX [Vicinamibacterales bacterium]